MTTYEPIAGWPSERSVLGAVLEPLGLWPPNDAPLRGAPHAAIAELVSSPERSEGIWECTPGSFRSQRDGYSETMWFVSGRGTLTGDDGVVHELVPGAIVTVEDGWSGTWDIAQTVRKYYVSVTTPE